MPKSKWTKYIKLPIALEVSRHKAEAMLILLEFGYYPMKEN
jgi:hypothetical protein